MNDNPTLRPFESYLDEVAREEGFQDYGYMSVVLTDDCLADQLIKHTTEANRRMLEDAFKAQKEICAEHAKVKTTYKLTDKIEITDAVRLLSGYVTADKSSIKNAPTPTIDNQNKN